MMKRILVLFTMLFAWQQIAQAGGFQIPEMGVKAMGMGNAFTGVADDPSANWFNPAGLSFQQTAVTVGAVAVMPKVDFTANASNPLAPSSSTMDKKTIVVPHAYMVIATDSDLTAGIGINAPFGLEVKWPTTAVFSGAAEYGRLQAINVNGNVAFKLSDSFALAAGVDFVDMYKVDFNGTALKQNFKGTGWGYNVAALYKSEMFNAGVSYRSSVKIKSKGQSTHVATATTSSNAITVTMPDILNIGVSVHPTAAWTISADADWVNWKKFDKLAFTYSPALAGGALPSLTVQEKWKATWAFRVGAEWAYSDTMRARFGYTYDPTPIDPVNFTPLLPGNDRQAVHVGYGVDLSDNATLDLAYIYVWLTERNQTASLAPSNWVRNGIYKSTIHLAAASLTYRF
ncbi:MAG: long chain fatty acid transport protein [Zetaproteobacteria bacterium CG_4_9_14_3_um_filter_54_145]|nr:MAG: long chain fatty acid transport protein [Zetaproteobacteria bacterium CG_4_10_14_3_um_filter_54_28]PJA28739.1 MAG: long chain fatty acid transport protein [Zetaproteobacteria bacterium CG_4_9_14_3_um_filter_54_145]